MEERGVFLFKAHLSWYSLATYTKNCSCAESESTLALAAVDLRGSAPVDMRVLC